MKEFNTNRRHFLNQIAGVTALTAIGLPLDTFAKAEKYSEPKEGDVTAPYLQNLSSNGVSIVVIEAKDTVTWLELNDGTSSKDIINKKDGFFEAGRGAKTFRIEDLVPGKTYTYNVLRREIIKFDPYSQKFTEVSKSTPYQFTTPAKNKEAVSCLIMNDIHDRPHTFKDLISLHKGEYDFVVFNGDTFDYQTDEKQLIDHLITPVTDIFASEKPFLMVRGNHETRGRYAREFKDYFAYPQGEYYFNFQEGPVNFTVLDTGEDKPDDHEVYGGIVDFDSFREEQAVWLEKVMKSKTYKKSPFKVVLMHIPPFNSDDWHGTVHCRKLFAPLFEKYKVDVVISGHTHRYGVHLADKDHSFPLIIGGGPKEGQRTLISLTATKSDLAISMIKDDGTVVGEVKLKA